LERSTRLVAQGQNAALIARLSSQALIPIQRGLAERRVIGLEYQGAERREVTRRDVEPLGLVYYSDNWHLIAYCRLRHDVRDFRTDRIGSIQIRGEIFAAHAQFSLERYLENAAQRGKFEAARVKFTFSEMERVRREWHCRLVEESSKADGVIVTLLAYSLEWLTEWLLSFGSKAEVLAPERLKELVADEARKMAALYKLNRRVAPPQAPVKTSLPELDVLRPHPNLAEKPHPGSRPLRQPVA
jgi:predicted DNA-binding transcriptional regulator YafY